MFDAGLCQADGREEAKEKGSSGNGLRSHTATGAVSSALAGLTTGFEKGPGVTLPL